MQIWLAILDRAGVPSPPEVEAAAARFLPFHPQTTGSAIWTASGAPAALFTWTNGPSEFPSGLSGSGRAAVAIGGYVVDGGRLLTPDQVAEDIGGTEDAVAGYGGVFSIARLDADGSITAWNTLARLEHVYWCRAGSRTVVSNRALAAHLVAHRTRHPSYDARFLSSLLAAGFPTTEATPFARVFTLGPGRRLHIQGGHISTSKQTSSTTGTDLATALTSSVAFLPSVDPAPRSALTGGKDSRLIAAVLSGAEVDFTAMTGGLDEHPDVVIASRAADILGVEHVRTRAGTTGEDAPTHLTHHVLADSLRRIFGSDGTHPAFELISRDVRVRSDSGVVLGGQGGELLRGGYAKKPVPTHRSARDSLLRLALRHQNFLSEDSRQRERRRHLAWLALAAEFRRPSTALWHYYLQFRTGRWAAAGYAAASVGRPRVWPYFDAAVVRAITHLDPARRIDETELVATLRRLNPALVDLPLVGSRWQFEATGPIDDDHSAWEARAPLTAPPGRASFDWRFHFSSGLGDLFVERVLPALDRPELDGVLDSARVDELIGRLRQGTLDGDRSAGHFAWLLFSVALLLSDQWLEPDPPKDVVTFPVPR